MLSKLTDMLQGVLNFYDAISRISTKVSEGSGNFVATFSPVPAEDEYWKIVFDLIGLGFALTMSPMWNNC